MNSVSLFMASGLQSPWQVKEATFSTAELACSELHLHIDFAPGSRFPGVANELIGRELFILSRRASLAVFLKALIARFSRLNVEPEVIATSIISLI